VKNYWLKSGFYALLNQLTQLIFNLGTVVILWRELDEKTCGVWVLYLTITAFIEIGRTGLLQNGLMTYLNKSDKKEHAAINTASLFLNVSLSLICVLVLLLGGRFIGYQLNAEQLPSLLAIYAATTFVLSGLYQFNFIQQANLDFKGLFWSSFIKNGCLFFYVLYLKITHNHININELAICQLIAAFPAAIVAFSFAKKYFFLSKTLDWQWVKTLFNYGKYTFGTNIATMSYKNVDKFMLGKFILDKVSAYDLAIKINQMAEVPSMTLAAILFPQSAKRSNTEGVASAKYLYEKSVGVILAIIMPLVVFIILFANIIITVIGSEKYAHSAPILRLTVFYGVFMAFAMQFGTILDSIGKPKLNFYITTLNALVNLGFNYFFIKNFGLLGAAYGSLIAMTIMFIVMQTILNRLLGVNWLNTFRYMFSTYKELGVKTKTFLKKRQTIIEL
jgi:O-antigen/teichoic acid export membrane protein